MKFIDLHSDTLIPFSYDEGFSLYENDKMIDFVRMKKGGQLAQFFAAFLLSPESWERRGVTPMEDWHYIGLLRDGLLRDIAAHSDIIALARNYDEMIANEKAGKMSAFFAIEDGRCVDGKLENVKRLYDLDARYISLTWNYENSFGYPNSTDPALMQKGLKPFGKEAIEYMTELGMLVDVSHLSDGGFYDVVANSKAKKVPFVATHSNSRALANHPRNLTDDMLKLVGETGSVAGLNFYSLFINADPTDEHTAVGPMVGHLLHMKNTGGIGCVALGSDWDGVSCTLEVDSPDKMHLLFDAMKKGGFTESEIELIAYGNVSRVLKAALK